MDDLTPQMQSDPHTDRRFGDYIVEREIGRGGMGIVFRARHRVTGQLVALKLMAPDLAGNESFRERFVREAEAGPNLGHTNIVPVLESGEADGELFIAMELIEGTDLKGLIKQEGRLDPKRVLSIFRQAASALDAAHESGMVHRDVKPQNILVVPRETPTGVDRVYLTDFGLVRPLTSETTASRTGQVFGSVAYMAPELIEGIPADGRADVYALGCVVYECLTGVVPFERENEVSTVWAHIHEDPPLLTDTCRDLPGGLNDVVFKAMSKHPDDRFLTCGEFVNELELGLGRKLSHMKYAHVRPLVARVPRRKTEREVWAPNFFPELSRVRAASRERVDWRRAIALAAAVALLSSVQLGREGGLPQAVADVGDAAGALRESLLDSAFWNGARGPDGTSAASSTRPGSYGSEGRRDSGGLPSAPPVTAAPITRVSDGTGTVGLRPEVSMEPLIVYESGGEIYVVRPDGSDNRRITQTTRGFLSVNPQWSPDGTRILFAIVSYSIASVDDEYLGARVDVGDLYIMDVDGGNLTRLTDDQRTKGDPSWSPDGTKIAFHVRDPAERGHKYWIAVINADGSGTERRIVRGTNPDWSPDGRWIAFVPRPSGDPTIVPQDIWITRPDGSRQSLVAEGDLRYVEGADPTQDRYAVDPAWSPDGRSITFTHSAGGERMRLRIVDPFSQRKEAKSLARMPWIGSPDWTPDGRILFAGGRSSAPSIFYVIDRGGRTKPLIAAPSGNSPGDPTWRPVPLS